MTSPYRGQSNRRNRSGHRDWYERDPMDERSGYRDESAPESPPSRSSHRNRYGSSFEAERWNRNEPIGYNRNIGADFSSSSYSSYGSDYPDYSGHDEISFAGKGPKGYTRSDERIKEDISEALTRHSAIDASDIEIEVKEGVVILSGTVSQRRMKHLAEDAADRTLGVKDITNNIRVSQSPPVSEPRHGGLPTGPEQPESDSHLPTDKAMLIKKSLEPNSRH